jgi:hypothetical protein
MYKSILKSPVSVEKAKKKVVSFSEFVQVTEVPATDSSRDSYWVFEAARRINEEKKRKESSIVNCLWNIVGKK